MTRADWERQMQLKLKLDALPGYVMPPAYPGDNWTYVSADCALTRTAPNSVRLLQDVYAAYGMGALA